MLKDSGAYRGGFGILGGSGAFSAAGDLCGGLDDEVLQGPEMLHRCLAK